MVAKNKETYEAPTMLVVEVKTEGIICGSDPTANLDGYGNAFELD